MRGMLVHIPLVNIYFHFLTPTAYNTLKQVRYYSRQVLTYFRNLILS